MKLLTFNPNDEYGTQNIIDIYEPQINIFMKRIFFCISIFSHFYLLCKIFFSLHALNDETKYKKNTQNVWYNPYKKQNKHKHE